jgi:hypothetical protein
MRRGFSAGRRPELEQIANDRGCWLVIDVRLLPWIEKADIILQRPSSNRWDNQEPYELVLVADLTQ